jgi:hypothetical protein
MHCHLKVNDNDDTHNSTGLYILLNTDAGKYRSCILVQRLKNNDETQNTLNFIYSKNQRNSKADCHQVRLKNWLILSFLCYKK